MKRKNSYYTDLVFNEDEDKTPFLEESAGPETINGIIDNALFVKVRRDPSVESPVLEIVRKGDTVDVLEAVGTEKNKFYKVSTKKKYIGYISSSFVSIKEE